MYAELKEIKEKNHPVIFNTALTHLIDIGFRQALDITDSDIEELEGNSIMTESFVKDLISLTREIAQKSSPVELIKFCQIEKIYDTRGYKKSK